MEIKKHLFPNKYQSLSRFWMFFFSKKKWIFGQKNTFRPNIKTALETQNFFGVVRMEKLYPLLIIIAIPKPKISFGPKYPNFQVKICIFLSTVANWSLTVQSFQHERGVSLVPWYEDTESFSPSPEKNHFLAKKGQILAFWVHFVSCPSKKQCKQGA